MELWQSALTTSFCPGESANAVPHYHKLCSRDSHIWGIRRGQHNRSAMAEPRPGWTTFLIMVSPLPGKYEFIGLRSEAPCPSSQSSPTVGQSNAHLIQLISSLVETPRDKRDIKNVQWRTFLFFLFFMLRLHEPKICLVWSPRIVDESDIKLERTELIFFFIVYLFVFLHHHPTFTSIVYEHLLHLSNTNTKQYPLVPLTSAATQV